MNKPLAVEVRNLSKAYILRSSENGGEPFNALSNVSFQIMQGENIAIIGPNGSGKSTLLKILAGVTKPSDGSVTLTGKVANILEIGAGFHPELSGRENIFVNGQLLGFNKKDIAPKVQEILEFSGIGKFIEEPVKNYSNGMYLRLAFSIVAHLDFDIYLFDEVLGVGDAEFQLKFTQRLMQINRSEEKTLILVSHQINEFRKVVDSCFLLEKGILREFSTLELYFLSKRESTQLSKTINSTNYFKKFNSAFLQTKSSVFRWDEGISIGLKVETVVVDCFLGISIKNLYKETVFEVYFKKQLHAQTSVNCIVDIPPSIFNSGNYFVDVLFSDLEVDLFVLSDILSFRVNYVPKEWELENKTYGSMKPEIQINWK